MAEDWQQWAAPGAAWVLTYLIHSTLLIALVWLLSRRLDGRPGALDALWKTALVGGLITATLQTAAGVSPVGGRLDLSAEDEAAAGQVAAVDEARVERAAEVAPADEAVASVAPAPRERARAGYPASGSPFGSSSSSASSSSSSSGAAAASARAVDEVEDLPSPSASLSPPPSASASASASVSASVDEESGLTPSMGEIAALGSMHGDRLSGRGTGTDSGRGTGTGVGPGLWLGAAFFAWAVLAAFFGLGLIRAWWRLRKVLADRRPIEAGPARTMLERLAAGTLPRVRLSASTRVDVPIAVGVLRPEIVVPERALYQLDPAELESMLAHELAHLVRRDPAWRLITGFMHRVLFLQPLNRVAAVHLESASEVLCDDWAVERTDRPLALARCLTEVAGWVASPLGASVPAMARRGSGLGRRVRRLVAADDAPMPPRRDRWPVPFAAGALTLVVFTAPGATEMASPQPPAPMPPAPQLVEASVEPGEGVSSRGPAVKKAAGREGDARRLLEKLRGGTGEGHELSDWVALAQLLGSPQGQTLRAGDGGDQEFASGGGPSFSAGDIEDIIEGAVSGALGAAVDFDFDIDFDANGGFDVQIDGLSFLGSDNGDQEGDFDFDIDVEVPDFEFEIEVPEPPEPPEPPESDCDEGHDGHGSSHQHSHHHGLSREAVRELQRQAHQLARQVRHQARQAREQARQARDQALRLAREARRQAQIQRDEALRQAHEARERALREAHRAREQALREGREAREQAIRQGREAHEQAMRAHAEAMREHERAMREAERERRRQYEEALRRIQEQSQQH